jgi:hypothetical protein
MNTNFTGMRSVISVVTYVQSQTYMISLLLMSFKQITQAKSYIGRIHIYPWTLYVLCNCKYTRLAIVMLAHLLLICSGHRMDVTTVVHFQHSAPSKTDSHNTLTESESGVSTKLNARVKKKTPPFSQTSDSFDPGLDCRCHSTLLQTATDGNIVAISVTTLCCVIFLFRIIDILCFFILTYIVFGLKLYTITKKHLILILL